jgi:hypothetical protein
VTVFVREKKVRNRTGQYYSYYQLVRNEWVDGKVKQRVVKHLGRFSSPDARENADAQARRLRLLCSVIGCGHEGTKMVHGYQDQWKVCDEHRAELHRDEKLWAYPLY